MEVDKDQVWISKLYGCMFPGSPCHIRTETDGNILYLALRLLLGGDVTQFSFEGWWIVCIDFTTNSIFFCEVYSRSCIGLGLRATLFILISFHSLPCILTLHCADGGVGNSSFLSYAPSSACVISFHSSKPASIKVTCTEHFLYSRLLVTTFLIPFSLHMPLITTFLSLVVSLWGQFGRRNLLEKNFFLL